MEATWDLPAGSGRRPAEAPPAAAAGPASPAASPAVPPAVAFALGLAGLLAFWLAILKRERRGLFLAAGLLLVAAGAGLLLAPRFMPAGPAAGSPAAAGEPATAAAPRANDRLEWRRSLASGRAPLATMPGGSGPIQLWAAEEAILASRLDDAARALAAAGDYGESAAAARLRARLAGRRGDGTGVMAAYLELVRRWPHDEAFLIEANEATYQLGFEKQGKELTAQLRRRHPRWPEGLRLLALADALEGLPSSAGEAMAAAIRSAAQRRLELIGSPLEAYLLEAAPQLERMLELGEAEAPLFACPNEGLQPLPARPGAAPARVGASLYYQVAGARLEIPGGCGLAPAGAAALSGEAWLDRRDTELRADAAELGRTSRRERRPADAARARAGSARPWRPCSTASFSTRWWRSPTRSIRPPRPPLPTRRGGRG